MDTLSGRQRACLELARQGLTNEQIADRLCVTRDTVKSHLDHACRRLGLDDVGNPRVVAAVLLTHEHDLREGCR